MEVLKSNEIFFVEPLLKFFAVHLRKRRKFLQHFYFKKNTKRTDYIREKRCMKQVIYIYMLPVYARITFAAV